MGIPAPRGSWALVNIGQPGPEVPRKWLDDRACRGQPRPLGQSARQRISLGLLRRTSPDGPRRVARKGRHGKSPQRSSGAGRASQGRVTADPELADRPYRQALVPSSRRHPQLLEERGYCWTGEAHPRARRLSTSSHTRPPKPPGRDRTSLRPEAALRPRESGSAPLLASAGSWFGPSCQRERAEVIASGWPCPRLR